MKRTLQHSALSFQGESVTSGGYSSASKMSSYSENNTDQNELIDQMQEKIGELLKANQKIGVLQKQVETLKLQIAKNNENFEIEKENLKKRIKEDQNVIESLKNQIDGLQTELNKRSDDIINLKNQAKRNEENNKQILKNQQDDFDAKLELKNIERIGLSRQLEDLRREMTELKETNNESKKEIHELQLTNNKLENEKQAIIGDKEEAERRNNSYMKLIHDMKEEKEEKEKELNNFMSINRKLNAEIEANKQTISSTKAEADKLTEKLTIINELLPEYTSFNELVEQLRIKIELAEVLPIELKKMKKQMMKAIKAAELYSTKMDETQKKMNEMQEHSNIVIKRADETAKENQEIRNKYNFIAAWKKNVKGIEKSNSELNKELNEINAALKGIPVTFSMRSLLIATMLANRWRKILGTEKKYEKDVRNWWWICGPEDKKRRRNETMENIEKLLASKNKLNKEIDELKLELMQASTTNEDNEKYMKQKEEEQKQTNFQRMEAEAKIERLTSQLQSKVSKEEYTKIKEKLDKSQQNIKQLQRALSKSTEQIVYLEHEVSVLRQREMAMPTMSDIREKEETHKKQLETKENEIKTLKTELKRKKTEEEKRVKEEKLERKPYLIEREDTRPIVKLTLNENHDSNNQSMFQKLTTMSRNMF